MDAARMSASVGTAAIAASRRRSFAALAGAALVNSALRAPAIEARKNKNGKKHKNRAKRKCQKQVAACRDQLRGFCRGDAACATAILPCCSPLADCQAGDTLDCAYAYLEQ